jgi:hypothetical protein
MVDGSEALGNERRERSEGAVLGKGRVRVAVELVREAAGVEAAMIAQLTVDLAMTAAVTGPFPKQNAKDLLRQRLKRHRAKLLPVSSTVH